MNYKQFLSTVESEMRSRFDSTYSLSIQSILRNNGTTLDGLIIFKPSSNITPTIYLNPYYHRYLDGVSMEDICEDIFETYTAHCPDVNMDTAFFSDFSRVKKHIVMKLINYERNEKLLQDVPFIPFLDLAVVFQVFLSKQPFGSGTILIHNSHMELWDTTAEGLLEAAKENSPRILPPFCEPIVSCIHSLMEPIDFPDEAIYDCNMKVLSNADKTNGAAVMLYEGVMKALADEHEQDLLVLPSSIHEVILLPADDVTDTAGFTPMIQEINETQLQDDEILSDHPYYYHRETGQITAIA